MTDAISAAALASSVVVGFPVFSTSVETRPCKRFIRVMRRSRRRKLIEHGGVFNCRKVAGTNVWSQHAWGNAVDLFVVAAGTEHELENLQMVAYNAVLQGTKRTAANLGKPCKVHTVIYANHVWERATGWKQYDGEFHHHVHVDFDPHREGVPPCVG
jgi:hypothetical protein